MILNKKPFIINENSSVRDVLVRINTLAGKGPLVVFVIDEHERLLGSVSDGDIRRGLLNGATLQDKVSVVMNKSTHFLSADNKDIEYFQALKDKNLKIVPFVEDGKVKCFYDLTRLNSLLPLEVIIMAGGEGRRLRPLTDDTPKPLLKVGSKPIIEHNIDRLINFGISRFQITVKYLGDKIVDYLGDGSQKKIKITYVHEQVPLGTIGALSMVESIHSEHILVMNSDILTNLDYEDFYLTFLQSGADFVVATIPYVVKVPYGVIETGNTGSVLSLKEKPTYTYYSNAGIYLIKRELLKFIPSDSYFDATDFIKLLIEKDKKVVSYPILQYWLDIGKPEDFAKANEDIKHIAI